MIFRAQRESTSEVEGKIRTGEEEEDSADSRSLA